MATPVPDPEEGYCRKDRQPPGCVVPELLFFCRRVYDYRIKRLLKNPYWGCDQGEGEGHCSHCVGEGTSDIVVSDYGGGGGNSGDGSGGGNSGGDGARIFELNALIILWPI